MLGLGLALATARSRGGGAVDNGVAISNMANTVVSAGIIGPGYRITKSAGAAAWDASADSDTSITGNCSAIIRNVSGSYMAGLGNANPAGSVSYDFVGIKLWFDNGGAAIYVYQNASQIGAARPFKNFGRITYTAGTDTYDVYTSDDGVNWGAAIQSFPAVGAGGTLWFDSSLNSVGATFEARFS